VSKLPAQIDFGRDYKCFLSSVHSCCSFYCPMANLTCFDTACDFVAWHSNGGKEFGKVKETLNKCVWTLLTFDIFLISLFTICLSRAMASVVVSKVAGHHRRRGGKMVGCKVNDGRGKGAVCQRRNVAMALMTRSLQRRARKTDGR
jgi:hypothetical protein